MLEPHAEYAYATLQRTLGKLQQAVSSNDISARGQQAGRAMSLIGTLRATLDHAEAPDVCGRLDALYTYCNRRLLSVSLGETQALAEVVALTDTLHTVYRSRSS